MVTHKLILPQDFDDYAWEVESKGCFVATAEICGNHYEISFYDSVRLSQEIADELEGEAAFFESNLVVLNSVDRHHMETALSHIAQTNKYEDMVIKKP